MAQAKQAGRIKLEGQEEGDLQQNTMGVYELVEGKEVNGRGVWKCAGYVRTTFMYYASSDKWWFISDREDMEAGEAAGWLYVNSTALTPDKITEGWQVTDGTGTWPETWRVWDGKAWVDASKVRARLA
jgi:hypothetical protein